jgi:glycosyltransferase involved in cell wall biosynthesis
LKYLKKITLLLPDLTGGGAERVAVNLVNQFVSLGYKCQIVLLVNKGVYHTCLDPRVEVVELGVKRVRGTLLPLVKHLRTERPDALLVFMWPLTVIAVVAKWLARVPLTLVVAEHQTLSLSEASNTLRFFFLKISMRLGFRYADQVVCVSRGASRDLAQIASLPKQSVKTIYNPIVQAREKSSQPVPDYTQWWFGEHYRLVAAGKLKKQKDYPTMLRALVLIRRCLNVRLLILGDGEEKAQLQKLASDLRVDDIIDFAGFVPEPYIFMHRAHLFLHTARWEGFGNVIVEALEAGLPIVCTDCPSGPREILENGKFGSLVSVGNFERVAHETVLLLRGENNPERQKARARDFTVESSAIEYLKVMFPEA